jgi:hypothetical protein
VASYKELITFKILNPITRSQSHLFEHQNLKINAFFFKGNYRKPTVTLIRCAFECLGLQKKAQKSAKMPCLTEGTSPWTIRSAEGLWGCAWVPRHAPYQLWSYMLLKSFEKEENMVIQILRS